MNIGRLTNLVERLELGAPEVAFCLGAPRTTIAIGISEDADPFDVQVIQGQMVRKGLTTNDIACGIDGYAVQLFAPDYPLSKDIFHDPFEQEAFTRFAVDLLGLPWTEKGERWGCGHDLFEPPEMAWEYTPEQSAKAVRRLLAGEQPWPPGA